MEILSIYKASPVKHTPSRLKIQRPESLQKTGDFPLSFISLQDFESDSTVPGTGSVRYLATENFIQPSHLVILSYPVQLTP